MYGLIFNGKRFDIGNKMGFLKTNIIYGLKDDEIGEDLKQWLKSFVNQLG
jgi:UTP--glucose-1-phosphate uridylyltransferase